MMLGSKPFQSNGELDVAGAYDVLDFEVGEFRIEAQLLNDAGVLAAGQFRIIFGFRARDPLTILPDAKIKAVVLGSRIRMMTAAKR